MSSDLDSELAVVLTSKSDLDFGKSYVDFLFWSYYRLSPLKVTLKIGSMLGFFKDILSLFLHHTVL